MIGLMRSPAGVSNSGVPVVRQIFISTGSFLPHRVSCKSDDAPCAIMEFSMEEVTSMLPLFAPRWTVPLNEGETLVWKR